MNSQKAFINRNSSVLGTSSSTCVKGTESTTNSDGKGERRNRYYIR